jgi:hypothetical protein
MSTPVNLETEVRQRLQSSLASLLDGTNRIRPPAALLAAVAKVRARWGNGAIGRQKGHVVEHVVQRLLQNGGAPTRRELFFLSFSLSTPLEALRGVSLLNTSGLFSALLTIWREQSANGKLGKLAWRGLYSSYLMADDRHTAESLRLFVASTREAVFQTGSGRTLPWMEHVIRHLELLGKSPCSGYANDLLEGNSSRLEDLLASGNVPHSSWFWAELVDALVVRLGNLSESVFKAAIPRVLDLSAKLPNARGKLLAALINRFPSLRDRSKHDLLLSALLFSWGSPQLDSAVQWSNVSKEAKAIACGWLAQEDLEDFYHVCHQNGEVDNRRLRYWLRFKNQMSFTKIVLGEAITSSRSQDYVDFRKRKRGRLGDLTDDYFNNAIIIQIRGWVFAEFSQVNNACYPYKLECCPFKKESISFTVKNQLKSTHAVSLSGAETLSHMSSWEQKFDGFLRSQGIYPDQ